MKITFYITILQYFIFSFQGYAHQNQWNKMADFGAGERERSVSFSIGLKGYVATGQDSANLVHNDLWEYEPASNTWTQKASMPAVGRRNAVAFSINGLGYVGTGIDSADGGFGGGNRLSDFWEYNPQLNWWIQKADYPDNFGNGIYFATAFTVGSKGYICCGKRGPSNYSNQTYEYNPLSNTWLLRAIFPGATRYALTSFSIGNKGYVGTGVDENLMRKDFYAYTPSSNTWAQIADMPVSGRSACSAFSIGNQGFVVFGTDGGFKDELWEYHPSFNMWFSRATFPGDPRKGAPAFAVGNKGYGGMGKADAGGVKRNFYEYTPTAPVGINELADELELNIYPNPSTDYVNFSFKQSENYNILIYDANAKLVKNIINSTDKKIRIDFTNSSAGLYFYQIVINNSIKLKSGKLIVKK